MQLVPASATFAAGKRADGSRRTKFRHPSPTIDFNLGFAAFTSLSFDRREVLLRFKWIEFSDATREGTTHERSWHRFAGCLRYSADAVADDRTGGAERDHSDHHRYRAGRRDRSLCS